MSLGLIHKLFFEKPFEVLENIHTYVYAYRNNNYKNVNHNTNR